jgi:hypothetical protein
MPEVQSAVQLITVATAPAIDCEVTFKGKISYDILNCPFGNTHPIGNITHPHSRIYAKAKHYMGMIGKKCPFVSRSRFLQN